MDDKARQAITNRVRLSNGTGLGQTEVTSILEALTDAGLAIVPRVPSQAMIDAWREDQAQGRSLQSSYAAMLAASEFSQGIPPSTKEPTSAS